MNERSRMRPVAASRSTARTVVATLLALGGGAGAVLAQQAPPQQPADSSDVIPEVTVTAQRQGAEAISRVPMSITAKTQQDLDNLDIKTGQDLARVVPALNVSSNGPTGTNISIRGISSANGAATTGIYLDDSALQTRTLLGIANGGGVFIPQLFDLERVEVLKGPQGTLYGGSSEGGTVRFITPEPSLTNWTAYAKAEMNDVYDGGPGGEFGVAVGGPIVENEAGFRLSAWGRQIGGWVDHVDWRNGNDVASDTNSETQQAFRLSVKVLPIESLTVTPAMYYGSDYKRDGDGIYQPIPSFTTPAFGTLVSTGKAINGSGLLPAGYTAPTTAGVVTNVPGYAGQGVYVHPAYTYPALNLGRYDTIVNTMVGEDYNGTVQPETSPRKSTLFLPSLTLDWAAGPLNVKSITTFVHDETNGDLNLSAQEIPNATATAGYSYEVQSPYIFDLATPFTGNYYYAARRNAIAEELRLSSPTTTGRLSWLAGLYYNDAKTYSSNVAWENRSAFQQTLFGHLQPGATADPASTLEDQTAANQWLEEKELAGFGELNFKLTDTLKLTGGVRLTREEIDFTQEQWGLLYNNTQATAAVTQGDVVEHPVTPKAGISWQVTENDLLYATAAKGYRAGGVQGQASPVQCAADLKALDISSTPSSYGSDSVWSYEAGAKLSGWDGRARIAASGFYISWEKPQTPYTLPTCVFNYITNIGKAVSDGFDLQAEVSPLHGLLLNLALAYTDAHYTQQVNAVNGALLVADGQQFTGIPNWTGNVGGRYDLHFGAGKTAYFQANFQYIGNFRNSGPPGTPSYSPDFYTTQSMNNVTARIGLAWDHFDVSLFGDNLFNESDLIPNTLSGRYGCRNVACTTYGSYYEDVKGTTFRPRTIGITGTWRY